MISLNNVMGFERRWKNSIVSLRLRFLEIPHKKIWVSWEVLVKGLGVQKGAQTPCWLRPCLEICKECAQNWIEKVFFIISSMINNTCHSSICSNLFWASHKLFRASPDSPLKGNIDNWFQIDRVWNFLPKYLHILTCVFAGMWVSK